MNELIIDTNFYTYFMRGEPGTNEIITSAKLIGLCPIVIGELLYGFKNSKREKENLKQLQQFMQKASIQLFDINDKTAEYFALIIQQLRQDGNPIPTNDIWIAACAMQHGLKIASFDKHFNKIKGILIAE